MAVPSNTTLIDDFNRADGLVTAGAGSTIWGGGVQSTQGLRVISNQLGNTTNGFNGVTASSFGTTQDLVLDCTTTIGAGSYIAIWWSLAGVGTSTFSGMALVILKGAPDTWQIRRYTAGANVGTQGSGTATTLATSDRVWINSTGTVHTVYVARAATPNTWTQVATATDSTYNRSGPWGFELGDTTQRWDNLLGGTVGGTTPVTVTPSASTVAFTAAASAQAATAVTPAAAAAVFASAATATAKTGVTPAAANAAFSAAATVSTSATVDLGTVTAAAVFTAAGSATAALGVTPSPSSVSFAATGAATAVSNVAGTATVVFATTATAAAPTAVTPGSANTVFGAGAVVTTPGTPSASTRLPLMGVGT